jgi:hypothetical protein
MLHYTNYNTIGEYLAMMDNTAPHPRYSSSRKEKDREWAYYSFDDAQEAARKGSKYHRERSVRMRDKILNDLPELNDSTESILWDVAPGMAFDMARVIDDTPEQWFCIVDKPVDEITIVVNGVYCYLVKAQRIERAGAAVCALVDILQTRGIGVRVVRAEVWSSGGSVSADHTKERLDAEFVRGSNLLWLNTITVQQPDSPCDPDALAYWIGSSDAMRRHGFAAAERLQPKKYMEMLGMGYGASGSIKPMSLMFPAWASSLNGHELVIDSDFLAHNEAFASDDGAAQWLRKQVERYTVLGDTEGTTC